jgi:hypothetical protein
MERIAEKLGVVVLVNIDGSFARTPGASVSTAARAAGFSNMSMNGVASEYGASRIGQSSVAAEAGVMVVMSASSTMRIRPFMLLRPQLQSASVGSLPNVPNSEEIGGEASYLVVACGAAVARSNIQDRPRDVPILNLSSICAAPRRQSIDTVR